MHLQDDEPREIVSFLKPNLTIQTVDHFAIYPKRAVPPQVSSCRWVRVKPHSSAGDLHVLRGLVTEGVTCA